MTLSQPLAEGMKIKLGLYNTSDKPVWETYYPDDNVIEKVDDTHYFFKLDYNVTRKLSGNLTLRAAIYTEDLEFVNAGNNYIPMNWIPEPVTKTLR